MFSNESFWDIDDQHEETIRNERLLLIPKEICELEIEAEQAKEELDYLEILRARQHQKLFKIYDEYIRHCDSSQYPEYEKMLKRAGNIRVDVFSELENQVLRIKMDFLLPIYHKTKNMKFAYYTALQDIYQKHLIDKLIQNRRELPNFKEAEKVFVLIVQYFSNDIISDLDNRFHSFIFNALRSAQITPDDRWQKLSYMEDGRKTNQKPYTEIFVGDFKKLTTIINFSQQVLL